MKRVRKQRKLFIFGLILLLIGCGILLYPHILQKFYKIKTESMFRQFEETTENVRDANPEKYARLYEEMKNYNEELIKNNQAFRKNINQIRMHMQTRQSVWKSTE